MAKKNKKPNHTRLVVPGATPARDVGGGKKQKKGAEESPSEERSSRFDNTIDLTKDGALIRKKAARRRKRRHGLQVLLLVVVFAGVLFLYFSGIYRTAVLKGTDWIEGIGISLQGGGSFPLPFDVSGYIESDSLGTNGIVVLGEKDAAIVSAGGRELYRFQHGYGNPHLTASDTRVCLYNRGGNEFTIEGRESRITARTTERDILFAQMSPNGALALATTSRFRSSIEIYSNYADDEPQFAWELTDEKPYAAAFYSDNKHLALACVSTRGGAIHSNIYLLHANRSEVQATINGGAATVLDIQYLSQSRVLVVYDSYAALYNSSGEETSRYDYGGQSIVTVDSREGFTALVFGSVSNNKITGVLLDADLAVTATVGAETAESPRVLVDKKAVYLLTGYDVAAYDFTGSLLNTLVTDYKGYDLAWAGEPLLVTAGDIQNLSWMADPEADGPEGDTSAAGVTESETTALPEENAGGETPEEPGENADGAGSAPENPGEAAGDPDASTDEGLSGPDAGTDGETDPATDPASA